jgi:hypothetical protein
MIWFGILDALRVLIGGAAFAASFMALLWAVQLLQVTR